MHDTLITVGKVVLLAACFLGPLFVRFWTESKKIPTEKKLEWSLHRGARALRQLGRARRNLESSPEMATRIAARARKELRTVQRIVTGDGCPVAILRRLEEARIAKLVPVALPCSDENTLLHEANSALDDAKSAIHEWRSELCAADERLAREADPTIYRSGGTLRNPFKQQSLDEAGQTESIHNIRRSQEDLARVGAALVRAAEAVSSTSGTLLVEAINALDSALADSDMPLPPQLATGESPHDFSNPPPPPGALQRLHAVLSALRDLQLAHGDYRIN
jgi:hypothetical protein